jgi:hypothetical protein
MYFFFILTFGFIKKREIQVMIINIYNNIIYNNIIFSNISSVFEIVGNSYYINLILENIPVRIDILENMKVRLRLSLNEQNDYTYNNLFIDRAKQFFNDFCYLDKKIELSLSYDMISKNNLLLTELIFEMCSYYLATDNLPPHLNITLQHLSSFYDRSNPENLERMYIKRLKYTADMYSLSYGCIFDEETTNEDLQKNLLERRKNVFSNPYFTKSLQFHINKVIIPYNLYLTKGPFLKYLSKEQLNEWIKIQKYFCTQLQNNWTEAVQEFFDLSVNDIQNLSFEDDFLSYIKINNILTYYEYAILGKNHSNFERVFFNELLRLEYELYINTTENWNDPHLKVHVLFFKCFCNDYTNNKIGTNLFINYYKKWPKSLSVESVLNYYKRKRILAQWGNYKRFYFF